MVSFLKYCAVLLGLLAVLMFALDYLYSYVYQHSDPRLKVQKILQQKNQHYDIVFFGSSRTENNIDCKLVEKLTGKSCINLGVSGASLTDMLILMKIAALNNTTFDTALVQIDYNYNQEGMSAYFKAGIMPFIKKPEIGKLINDSEKSNAYYYIPFYRYMIYSKVLGVRELLASILNEDSNLKHSLGFTPKVGQGLEVAGNFPNSIKGNNKDLNKMIKWSEEKNVQVLFFTAPYCPKVENREVMREIEKKLPNLKNYITLFDDQEEYFFNCGHLNKAGAEKFTKKLTQDILLD